MYLLVCVYTLYFFYGVTLSVWPSQTSQRKTAERRCLERESRAREEVIADAGGSENGTRNVGKNLVGKFWEVWGTLHSEVGLQYDYTCSNFFFFNWWTQDIFHVFPILFSYVEKLTLMNIWMQFCVVIHVDCFASFRSAQRRPQSFSQRRLVLRRKRLNSSLRKPQIQSEKSRASKLLPLRCTTLAFAVWEVWNLK